MNMAVAGVGRFCLGGNPFVEELRVVKPQACEVQQAGAPTPAGPCCTIGTVGDEVATSVENMATMSGQNTKKWAAFDAGTHDHPVLADGGLTGPSPAAAVTGFAGYAALVTLKASYEIVQEQSARQQSAQAVLANLERYQRVRQEGVDARFDQDFTSAVTAANSPEEFIAQLDTEKVLAWVDQEIERSQVYGKIAQLGVNYRENKYKQALLGYVSQRKFDVDGVRKVLGVLGTTVGKKQAWYEALHAKNAWGVVSANNKAWVLEQMQKTRQDKKAAATANNQQGRLDALNALTIDPAIKG